MKYFMKYYMCNLYSLLKYFVVNSQNPNFDHEHKIKHNSDLSHIIIENNNIELKYRKTERNYNYDNNNFYCEV